MGFALTPAKGIIFVWIDEITATAEGRRQMIARLQESGSMRGLLSESIGWTWRPQANVSATSSQREVDVSAEFWFPSNQPEAEATVRRALIEALEHDLPLTCWWDATSGERDTREIFVNRLEEKVSVLFYSDNPDHPPPPVYIFRAASRPIPHVGARYHLWSGKRQEVETERVAEPLAV